MDRQQAEIERLLPQVASASSRYDQYIAVAVAVVAIAREDIASGVKVFETWGAVTKNAAIQRAAMAWRWMSDPYVDCWRLSFLEICDGCGIDQETALDGVDDMARAFPDGYRKHLEYVGTLLDAKVTRKQLK